ncbi:hypothetical protein H0O03_01655 [Candidatus Micrarchaeota archaeon]|nr:hypothetical protein [Candidatus Micrarchaeota archaeon]
MKIVATAPTKIILCGEHAVVHGANAIAAPISFRNTITLDKRVGEPKFVLHQPAAPDWHAELAANGTITGTPVYHGLMRMAAQILREQGTSISEQGVLYTEFKFGFSPKGTGNSASIAAAIASALYAYLKVKPSRQQLFDAIQTAEKEAHGNPSGIDARTVISNCAQRFHKEWDSNGNTKFFFEDADLKLPKGTKLLIIDSLHEGEKPQTTSEMVAIFSNYYFKKGPTELNASERKRIADEFNPIVFKIESQLRENGDATLLGKYFNENHEMLRKTGVSSEAIEGARKTALDAGAFGAKLTGAGGRGGAVIALVAKEKLAAVRQAMTAKSLKVSEAEFDSKGITLETID